MNQYETQALEQELKRRGHTLADFEETADIYVVNTCSVTAVSDKKSRQMLRQARRRNPAAVIAACGCYAQTHPEDVKKLDLDVIAGTNDRAHFIDLLERAAREKTHIVHVDDVWERREFEVLPAGGMVNRTRAMLKVEDGCVNFCTYCLIPYARGRVRSLPMEEAAKQVRALREEGYREIVVTGIEISSYGSDFKDGTSLIDLLELIARVGFAEMHVFPYSIRPGTKAAEMRQVDMPVREERAARAAAVAKKMHEAYLARCVGKTFPVLFERDRQGGSAGHAPNYMEVSVAREGLHNEVKNVKITAVEGGGLRGEVEE